jgi:hypothetical protein
MLRVVTVLVAAIFLLVPVSASAGDAPEATTVWQTPPEEVMEVLHAPQLPQVWTSPTGEHLLLGDPVIYPPLAELAGPMHKLAGIRVNPTINYIHGRHGATLPRLVEVEGGDETPLPMPEGVEVLGVSWTADGRRFALTTRETDHMGLWVGAINGDLKKIDGLGVNQLLGTGVRWMPDQKRLLVRRVPERGEPPAPPAIPAGPVRVTQPARNLPRRRSLLLLRHLGAGGDRSGSWYADNDR